MSATIHKTKGIVLRNVYYGDTSIIASVYTELFGLQSYIVKGVRKPGKKGNSQAAMFYPSAILELQVYHNEQKSLQFIKEHQWACLYQHIFFDVIKNAVAMFAIELLQHSIKQPETNAELYCFIEESFMQLDEADAATAANFPLYFALQLANQLGFEIHNNYSSSKPCFNFQEGFFVEEAPIHPHFIEGNLAYVTHQLLNKNSLQAVAEIKLNKQTRRALIDCYIQYFALHIANFIELRSWDVLKEVLD